MIKFLGRIRSIRSITTVLALLLFSAAGYAQRTVTGTVIGASDGLGLPGVNIVVVGTTKGAVTDFDGNYTIQLDESEKAIQFSMMGMVSQTVEVGNKTKINITMKEDVEMLGEVVKIGYGTMKKSDIAGSIVSLKAEELTEVKSNNVLESLQGKISGVDISAKDGRAGSGADIQVRGNRSLNASGSPLIIVDGIPQSGAIDAINPNDIASIEILKDAASTAIYGSRGANGIILITTKAGQLGEDVEPSTTVYYNAYVGSSQAYAKAPMYTADEYVAAKVDAYRDYTSAETFNTEISEEEQASFFTPTENAGRDAGIATDWQDEILQSGYVIDNHVGVRGSGKKMSYDFSVANYNQRGVVIGDNYQRLTGRANINAQINKRISVGTSVLFSESTLDGAPVDFTSAAKMSPIVPSLDSAGNYIYQPSSPNPRVNPSISLLDTREKVEDRLFVTYFANAEITDWLSFRSNIGLDYRQQKIGYTNPQYTINTNADQATGSGIDSEVEGGFTWNNVLTANKTFNEKHNVILTAGSEIASNKEELYGMSASEQQSERALWYALQKGKNPTVYSGLTETSMVSYLGRANYSYDGKYIASVAVRLDAASQLTKENRTEYFPGASLAWRVSKENFFAGLKNVMNDFKLRASYGSTGNASIPAYSKYGGLNPEAMFYEFGNTSDVVYQGFRPTSVSSTLKWERTNQINAGFDFAFLKNRFTGSFDYYSATTENILMKDRVPSSSGYYFVWTNAAETQSDGIEVMLTSHIIEKGPLKWKAVMNYSANNEEISKLAGGITEDEGNKWFVGQPINVFYDYEFDGIWQYEDLDISAEELANLEANNFNPLVGRIRVADANGDGKIDTEDRSVLGSESPDWTGTLQNVFTFKNMSISFDIYAKMGQMIDANAYDFDARMYNNMFPYEYWTPENKSQEVPRLDDANEFKTYDQLLSYRDGSFVKLRSINIGWDLPKAWLSKAKISNLRVYANCKNVAFLYTNVEEGVDPERGGSISWPLSRTYTVGLNLEF